MLKLLKKSLLSLTLIVTACAHEPQPISLGLEPITCPASALAETDSPPPLDPSMLSQMPIEVARYVASRDQWWENVLASGEQVKIDTLNLCRDVNNAIASGTNIR